MTVEPRRTPIALPSPGVRILVLLIVLVFVLALVGLGYDTASAVSAVLAAALVSIEIIRRLL